MSTAFRATEWKRQRSVAAPGWNVHDFRKPLSVLEVRSAEFVVAFGGTAEGGGGTCCATETPISNVIAAIRKTAWVEFRNMASLPPKGVFAVFTWIATQRQQIPSSNAAQYTSACVLRSDVSRCHLRSLSSYGCLGLKAFNWGAVK